MSDSNTPKILIDICPFKEQKCIYCGKVDMYNSVICEDCRVAGYKIIETINIHKYAANHIILIVQKNPI